MIPNNILYVTFVAVVAWYRGFQECRKSDGCSAASCGLRNFGFDVFPELRDKIQSNKQRHNLFTVLACHPEKRFRVITIQLKVQPVGLLPAQIALRELHSYTL